MVHTALQWIRRCLNFFLDQSVRCLTMIRKQVGGGRVLVKRGDVYYIPLWLLIAIALLLALAAIWDDAAQLAGRFADRVSSTATQLAHPPAEGELADFFAPSVHYWSGKISEWGGEYEIEPQLLATVMQIESCGHPTVVSSAGARGLFQVMPFHFADDEDMLDPDTNAMRGGSFLNYCYQAADGVIGLTLACYNGGPSVISRPVHSWHAEIQRYYRWGVGIYSDAITNQAESDILNQWMNAGGSRLCASALNELQNHAPPASASS